MARVSLLAAFLKTVGESLLNIFSDPLCEILKSSPAPHLNSPLSAFISMFDVAFILPVISIPVELVVNFSDPS